MYPECKVIPDSVLRSLIDVVWPADKKILTFYFSDNFKVSHPTITRLQTKLSAASADLLSLPREMKKQIRKILAEVSPMTNGRFLLQETMDPGAADITFAICPDVAIKQRNHNTGAVTIKNLLTMTSIKNAEICFSAAIIAAPPTQQIFIARHEILHAITGIQDIAPNEVASKFFLSAIERSTIPHGCSVLPYPARIRGSHLFPPLQGYYNFTAGYPPVDRQILEFSAKLSSAPTPANAQQLINELNPPLIQESGQSSIFYSVIYEMLHGLCDELKRANWKISDRDANLIPAALLGLTMFICKEKILFVGTHLFLTSSLPMILFAVANKLSIPHSVISTLLKWIAPTIIFISMIQEYSAIPAMQHMGLLLMQWTFTNVMSTIAYQGGRMGGQLLDAYLKEDASLPLPRTRHPHSQ